MKRRVAVIAVVFAGTTAGAAPGALVKPPAGWSADPEQAAEVGQHFAASPHFGVAHAETAAEAYIPEKPWVALYVTRATVTKWPGTLDQATRAAVDELHASALRGELTGGTPKETSWNATAEPAARQILATLTWADAASHTSDTLRLVVASDGAKVVAVTGECFATDEAPPVLVTACKAAVATIDTGIALDKRVAIGLAGDAPAAEPAAPASSTPDRPQMQLSDGGKAGFPPITISSAPTETDRRPMYIGGGLIVLAAAFWWNRRRRDRFDREDAGVPAKPRDDDSDDSDDLHAAARGKNEDAP